MSLFDNDYNTIVRLLREREIVAGAPIDVNIRNDFNETPLQQQEDGEIVEALVLAGADINSRDNSKNTPLHFHKDIKAMKVLILAGANVNARNCANATPLHYHTFGEQVEMLIHAGAEINARDICNRTPLHAFKDIKAVKILILAGADVNASANNNSIPLDILEVREVYDEILDAQKVLSSFVKRNFKYFVFKRWIKSKEVVEWLYHPKRGGKYIERHILNNLQKLNCSTIV